MRLLGSLQALCLFVVCVAAVAPQKQYLITYPKDIPASELDAHRKQITSSGGEILHEYQLIKGFIVKTTDEAIESLTTLLQNLGQFKPTIEEDSTVSIQQ